MGYFRLGDPLDDFNRLDREQAAWEAKLPKCECCGDPIQDERAIYIHDEWYHRDCLLDNFEKAVPIE